MVRFLPIMAFESDYLLSIIVKNTFLTYDLIVKHNDHNIRDKITSPLSRSRVLVISPKHRTTVLLKTQNITITNRLLTIILLLA